VSQFNGITFYGSVSGKDSKPTGKPLPLAFFHLHHCEKLFHSYPFLLLRKLAVPLTIDDNTLQNSDEKKKGIRCCSGH